MTSGGVECENDIAPLTFDSDCENVFKKEMEEVVIKSSKEFGGAMALDSTVTTREPFQSLRLNSQSASPLSPHILRKGATNLSEQAQVPQSEECKVSPLIKAPDTSKDVDGDTKQEESSAVPISEYSRNHQQTTSSTPNAQRVPMEAQADAQTDTVMGAKRRHLETENNAGIVYSTLKSMTPGSAVRRSKDFSVANLRKSRDYSGSSVRKSKDFAGRAGRILRAEGEGAGGDPSPRSARRRPSLGWFPRGQKTESYLERKIRMLQQKEGGKIATLDEMLGASNLHLSRVEREKRAASAAAKNAAEARKAALVEASWCRILKAAGIPYMAAALELQKAEKKADEALAAAAALGVHLGNSPRNPSLVSKPADSSSGAGAAATHNISATLETAFDVDKEVAAALKAALLRHTSDLKDAELRNAMRLIKEQQNLEAAGGVQPDWVDHASEASSAEDSNNATAELGESSEEELAMDVSESINGSNPLVGDMLTRVKGLQPEQCASLATIVATRGLNALLREESLEHDVDIKNGGGLGDILVKHVSRLEAEKAAALAAAKSENGKQTVPKRRLSVAVSPVPDLGNMFVKHVSRLEREKRAVADMELAASAKDGSGSSEPSSSSSPELTKHGSHIEGLENVGVKKMSKLEQEKAAAALERADRFFKRPSPRRTGRRISLTRKVGLGESLIKHKSRLEREVEEARAARRLSAAGKKAAKAAATGGSTQPSPPKKARNFAIANASSVGGLGDVLVKHKSRLEKEKEAARIASAATQTVPTDHSTRIGSSNVQNTESRSDSSICGEAMGLETVNHVQTPINAQETVNNNVAHVDHQQAGLASMGTRKLTKLETEKQAAANSDASTNPWARRRPSFKAREESADAWAGVSLGAALKRHVSKLEQEQAAWRSAEEEARRVGAAVHSSKMNAVVMYV